MNSNTRNGLLALGLAGVAAWFKMTPDQRANVKSKIAGAGNRLKENLPQDVKNFSQNVRNQVSDAANQVSNKAEQLS